MRDREGRSGKACRLRLGRAGGDGCLVAWLDLFGGLEFLLQARYCVGFLEGCWESPYVVVQYLSPLLAYFHENDSTSKLLFFPL